MNKIIEIVNLCNLHQISLAAVESFTGGLFASQIVAVAGASHCFAGALVTYQNKIKAKLGINSDQGVVNAVTAQEMALKGKTYFDVDYCLSFTGNAGPIAIEDKPVGLIYVAINERIFQLQIPFKRREQIQKFAVDFAVDKLLEIIKNRIK